MKFTRSFLSHSSYVVSLIAVVLGLARAAYGADYDKVTAGQPSHDFVVVNYDGQHIPEALEGMLRYNTVIRLPVGEDATEASAGDAADFTKPGSGDWVIQIAKERDAVYAKPARQGAATNIEIRTDHGNRYTFLIADHSLDKGAHLHLEYIINPTGQAEIDAIKAPAKYILAEGANAKIDEARADAARYKTELTELESKWQRRFTESQVSAREKTLNELACGPSHYSFEKASKEFGVQDVCADQDWLYIFAKGGKEFGLTDVSSGSPVVIIPEFDPASGKYTIHSQPSHLRLTVGNGKKSKSADIEKTPAQKTGA